MDKYEKFRIDWFLATKTYSRSHDYGCPKLARTVLTLSTVIVKEISYQTLLLNVKNISYQVFCDKTHHNFVHSCDNFITQASSALFRSSHHLGKFARMTIGLYLRKCLNYKIKLN